LRIYRFFEQLYDYAAFAATGTTNYGYSGGHPYCWRNGLPRQNCIPSDADGGALLVTLTAGRSQYSNTQALDLWILDIDIGKRPF